MDAELDRARRRIGADLGSRMRAEIEPDEQFQGETRFR
jgi:hypothetical protein